MVVSSAPPAWSELVAQTWPLMHAWTERHGYDFAPDVSDLRDRNGRPIRGFVKLNLLEHYLREYSRVLWLDADLVITNPEASMERLMGLAGHGITFGYDVNGHHSTIIAAWSDQLVRDYLWAANNAGRSMFIDHPWHEMEALRYFAQTSPYREVVCWRSIKETCPIRKAEYVQYGFPLDIGVDYDWTPEAFALHLSALSLDRRITLARHYADPRNFDIPPPLEAPVGIYS